jgi:hypothetical protein
MMIIILCFDMVTIPYSLAWDVPLKNILEVGAWISCVFWTLEVIVSFRTGFFDHGELEMRASLVAHHYLRTWFVPSMVIVVCDWFHLLCKSVLSDNLDSTTFVSLLQASRLLRMLGAARIKNVGDAVERIADVVSPRLRKRLHIPQIMLTLFWASHVLGCVWFAIGRVVNSDTGRHWTEVFLPEEHGGSSKSVTPFAYEYSTSIHYGLTLLISGNTDVNETNTWERLFSSGCIILGLVFVSSLTAIMSASLTENKIMAIEKTEKLNLLRRFLRQHNVSDSVSVAIEKQVNQKLSAPERLVLKDVPAGLISTHLLSELKFHMYRPTVTKQPLFLICERMNEMAMRNLCQVFNHDALTPGDTLFDAGVRANSAYVVLFGELNYMQESDSIKSADRTLLAGKDNWLAEAALWTEWTHVGAAGAKSVCEVLEMNINETLGTLKQYSSVWLIVREYGITFHRLLLDHVQHCLPEGSPVVTPNSAHCVSVLSTFVEHGIANDLIMPFTSLEVFPLMPGPARLKVGLSCVRALQLGRRRGGFFPREPGTKFEELRKEVKSLRSTLVFSHESKVLRILPVTAVELVHAGKVLVSLGKRTETGIVSFSCELPGGAQKSGEQTIEALHRFLNGKLSPFKDNAIFTGVRNAIDEKESKTYGILTKYTKTVHCYSLAPYSTQLAQTPVYSPRRPDGESEQLTTSSMAVQNPLKLPTFRSLLESSHLADDSFDVYHHDVLTVEHEESTYLYAWLTQSEFELLSSSAGAETLRHWIDRLELEDPFCPGELRMPDRVQDLRAGASSAQTCGEDLISVMSL